MANKKKKRPSIPNPKLERGTRISARKDDAGPANLYYPIYCLRHLDAKFGFDKCNEKELSALIKQLQKLSTLTWQEIQSSPRHGLGSEKIDRNAIKASIPTHITDDVIFLAFRFLGKKPFVGYRNGAVLHIVYVDRGFTLYSH